MQNRDGIVPIIVTLASRCPCDESLALTVTTREDLVNSRLSEAIRISARRVSSPTGRLVTAFVAIILVLPLVSLRSKWPIIMAQAATPTPFVTGTVPTTPTPEPHFTPVFATMPAHFQLVFPTGTYTSPTFLPPSTGEALHSTPGPSPTP